MAEPRLRPLQNPAMGEADWLEQRRKAVLVGGRQGPQETVGVRGWRARRRSADGGQ